MDIVTSYGRIEALKGVSLSIKRGTVTCLLGPNGAGKTTLMYSIAGILKPRRGCVRFNGREMTGATADRVVSLGIALVPENRLVFPQMSVIENLAAGAYTRHDRGAVTDDLERMLERFPALKGRRSQLAGTLSGGEQQMLAIARALMSRPELLMMDEPSVGLAPIVVEQIFSIVEELNRDGITIFMVEQNAHMALKVAHQFFVMEQGRVTLAGAPHQVSLDDVAQRAYLGSPVGV